MASSEMQQFHSKARFLGMTVQSAEGSNHSHPAETEKSVDALLYFVVIV